MCRQELKVIFKKIFLGWGIGQVVEHLPGMDEVLQKKKKIL
jgi:hypothetical protein